MYEDFLGQEIKEGDIVVSTQVGYRSLTKALIERITPKMVFLRSFPIREKYTIYKQFHNQVVRIPNGLA